MYVMINLPQSTFFISKTNFDDLEMLQKNLKSLLLNQKNKEKRKRNFARFFFQRIYCQTTCIDFFSKDIINSLLFAKKIARIFKEKKLTSEIFFLALCLNPETYLATLLKNSGVLKHEIIKKYFLNKKYSTLSKLRLLSFEKQILDLITPVFFKQSFYKLIKLLFFPILVTTNFLKNINQKLNNRISFPILTVIFKFFFYNRALKDIQISDECCTFLENLMYFAKIKYKTPLITNDLLALAFLDSKYSFFLKLLINNSEKLYQIKYSLIKNLHEQEASLKEDVPKNMQYFSYLLKNEYFEKDFQALIRKENLLVKGNLNLKTALLRNFTLKKIFKMGIFPILEKEIFQSIFISSKTRTYKYV